MPLIVDPEKRLWRTGSSTEKGNEIYALIYNDPTKPSRNDVLIGQMDTTELAEIVVNVHNLVVAKFGSHYEKMLQGME